MKTISYKDILLGIQALIVIVAAFLRINHIISSTAMQLIFIGSLLFYFIVRRLKLERKNQ
ncbi:hypothetical protein [Pontibacter sp. H249]|uniref:hypothetical protein n=1 Tax=Pontibacter sp. H249 TaxID=3133420 RepID=UPI0030C01E0B